MRTTEAATDTRRGRWVRIALIAPPMGMLAATALLVILGLAGRHPYWRAPSITLCEAVEQGNGAEILRQIRLGAPVNGACDGGDHANVHAATPLDVAVRAGRADLVRMLVSEGAEPTERLRRTIACAPPKEAALFRAVLESPGASEPAVCAH